MLSDSNCHEKGSFNGRLTFAFKLWEVANDGKLIKWNSKGDGVIVKRQEYEELIEEFYPGFAQNSSYLNLKRLFRDYGFQHYVMRRKKPYGLVEEFFHPMFRRDDYENIINVTAKERHYKYKIRSPSGCFVYRARRKYTRHFPNNFSVLCSSGPSLSASRSVSHKTCSPKKRGRPPTHSRPQTSSPSENSSFTEFTNQKEEKNDLLNHSDAFRLFQIFAKNELSEEDYVEAVLKRFGDNFQHLIDSPFDEIVQALDKIICPGLSPFYSTISSYEYSLEEL